MRDLKDLDAGQLDFMWSFIKLQKKNSCTKKDVQNLKRNLDYIREALIQSTGGQKGYAKKDHVNFKDLGTYINFVVLDALQLYIYGGLDLLENVLESNEKETENERDIIQR